MTKWITALRRLAVFSLLAVVAVSVVGYYQQRSIPRSQAPPLAYQSLNGKYLDLHQMTAKGPALVYFWATWCPYCRVVSPAVSDLSFDHQVISVAMQSGSDQALREYLAGEALHFPTVNDPDGALGSAWGVRLTPTIVIVNSRGEVSWVTSGVTSKWGLQLRLALTE